jgi:hypothetical protein
MDLSHDMKIHSMRREHISKAKLLMTDKGQWGWRRIQQRAASSAASPSYMGRPSVAQHNWANISFARTPLDACVTQVTRTKFQCSQ